MSSITATVVADSISEQGNRLTSMVLTLPQSLLLRLTAYRALSRAMTSTFDSGLGIVVSDALLDAYVPEDSATESLNASWLHARDNAVIAVLNSTLGLENLSTALRKSVDANRKSWGKTPLNAEMILRELDAYAGSDTVRSNAVRLLEPFLWTTCLVTATNWENLTALADSADERDFQMRGLASSIRDSLDESVANPLDEGQWHLPFVTDDEWVLAHEDGKTVLDRFILTSVGRCGGASLQGAENAEEAAEYASLLLRRGEVSAWEHAATPAEQSWGSTAIIDGLPSWRGGSTLVSNFVGWTQARKLVEGESVLNSVENTVLDF